MHDDDFVCLIFMCLTDDDRLKLIVSLLRSKKSERQGMTWIGSFLLLIRVIKVGVIICTVPGLFKLI